MNLSLSYILISVVGAAAGQVLLKRGMTEMGEITLAPEILPATLLSMASNAYVVIGLIVYVISTVFWLTALSRVDLSFAYPFVSIGYVIMLLASWRLFNEDINLTRLIGTAVVVVGVLLISRS